MNDAELRATEYIKKQVAGQNRVNLFKIVHEEQTYNLISDLRLEETWWNGEQYTYCPLLITDYQYTESNSATTPALSCVNLASLYNEFLASVPALEGAYCTYYQVYTQDIKATGTETQSSVYAAKFRFELTQLLKRDVNQIQYRIAPIGITRNRFIPARIIVRNGGILGFPGCGDRYKE